MANGAESGKAFEKLVALDAAIARGVDDTQAGRVKPSAEAFDQLEARLCGRRPD